MNTSSETFTPRLLVIPSCDEGMDLYAMVPSRLDIEAVREEMNHWLAGSFDYKEKDIRSKLMELGCLYFDVIEYTSTWD